MACFVQQSDQFIDGSFRQAEINLDVGAVLNVEDCCACLGDFTPN